MARGARRRGFITLQLALAAFVLYMFVKKQPIREIDVTAPRGVVSLEEEAQMFANFEVHSHSVQDTAIVTLVTGAPGHMTSLKRLVGSVHRWHPELPIVVYAVGIGSGSLSLVESWHNVLVVEVADPKALHSVKLVIEHALQRHGTVVVVDPTFYLSYRIDAVITLAQRDGFFVGSLAVAETDGQKAVNLDWCTPDIYALKRDSPLVADYGRSWLVDPFPFVDNRDSVSMIVLAAAQRLAASSGVDASISANTLAMRWRSELREQMVNSVPVLKRMIEGDVWTDEIEIPREGKELIEKLVSGDDLPPVAPMSTEKLYVSFEFDVDDHIADVFIDGEPQTSKALNKDNWMEVDRLRMKLAPGPHVFAIVANNQQGEGAFALRIQAEEDKKMSTLFLSGSTENTDSTHLRYSMTSPGSQWTSVEFEEEEGWKNDISTERCASEGLEKIRSRVGSDVKWVWPGGCTGSAPETVWIRVKFHVGPGGSGLAANVPSLAGSISLRKLWLLRYLRRLQRKTEVATQATICPTLSTSFPLQRQTSLIYSGDRVFLELSMGGKVSLQYLSKLNSVSVVPSKARTMMSSFVLAHERTDEDSGASAFLRYGDTVTVHTLKEAFFVEEDGSVITRDYDAASALRFTIESRKAETPLKSGQKVRLQVKGGDRFLGIDGNKLALVEEDKAMLASVISAVDYSQQIRLEGKALHQGLDADIYHVHGKHMHKHRKRSAKKGDEIFIALLAPSMAKPGQRMSELAFPTFFMDTLKESIRSIEEQDALPKSAMKFRYVIYLGYDVGDPVYDSDEGRAELQKIFDSKFEGYPIELKTSRHSGTKGAPCWVWNKLAEDAFHDGADYLYQLNDDNKFITKNWAEDFVRVLRESPVHRDVGVTGPLERLHQGGGNIIPQAFVSRLHMEIFPTFYPVAFKNWWSDDWITLVYRPTYEYQQKQHLVENTNVQGTRYAVSFEGERALHPQVASGKQLISKFLQEHGSS